MRLWTHTERSVSKELFPGGWASVPVFTVKEIVLICLTALHKWVWKRKAIPVLLVTAVRTGFIICNLQLHSCFNFSLPEAQDSFQMYRPDYLKSKREVHPQSILIFLRFSFWCDEAKYFFFHVTHHFYLPFLAYTNF